MQSELESSYKKECSGKRDQSFEPPTHVDVWIHLIYEAAFLLNKISLPYEIICWMNIVYRGMDALVFS